MSIIKKLYACIGKYKRDSYLTSVFVTCEVIIEVIIPYLTAKLIDLGIDAGNMGNIVKIGAVLVVSALVSLMFGALSGRCAAISSSGFAKNVREKMFGNIQSFSFGSIDKFSAPSLVTRLTTDVTNVQNAYQMIFRMAVRAPVMLIFSMIMSFRINSSLACVFLACIPVLGGGLFLIMTNAHPIFERVFKTYDKLNRIVQENLRGIRVVKSFVREEHETQKFEEVSGSIYKDFTKAEKLLSFNMPLMQFCMYSCMLLISWFGARIIVGTRGTAMSTGELMSFMTYVMQILMNLMMLSMVFVMLTISRASAERIVEVLDEKSDLTNCAAPIMELSDGSVRFENVSFSYSRDSQRRCLKNIDLEIHSGETVGIIGGTGSSKSSLVQLIPRLYDATEGTVSVGGTDVRSYDLETLRENVAMVLQKNVLFSGTIAENLRWGNENATDEELRHAAHIACADEFIMGFPDGYETHIEQGGTNVSGGQKQRLCIARALLKKPKVLILDDSTSAVDTKTDVRIRKSLAGELPDTTKIIIAQRISSVENADKIIVMDNGAIAAVGTHDELLLSCEIYRDVYRSQTQTDGTENVVMEEIKQ